MTNVEQVGQGSQPVPPVAVIVARLIVPLGIVLTYWAIRLPMFESPHAHAHVRLELFVALACTLLVVCAAGASLIKQYRRLVED